MQEAVCSVGVCRLLFHPSSSMSPPAREGFKVVRAEPWQRILPPACCNWQLHGAIRCDTEQVSHLLLLLLAAHQAPSLHTGTNCSNSVSSVMHEAQGAPRGLQTLISWLWFVALKMEYDHKKCLHLLIYKLPTAIPCLSTSRWRCAVNWLMGVKSFQTTRWKMLQK